MPQTVISAKSIPEEKLLVGKMLTRSISANQIFTALDVSYTRDPNSESALVPNGLVGLVLPESWLAAPLPKIKKDDSITIYVAAAANNINKEGLAGVIVKAAPVLAVQSGKDGGALAALLALDSEAVERILKAKASQYLLMAVVESGAIDGKEAE